MWKEEVKFLFVARESLSELLRAAVCFFFFFVVECEILCGAGLTISYERARLSLLRVEGLSASASYFMLCFSHITKVRVGESKRGLLG